MWASSPTFANGLSLVVFPTAGVLTGSVISKFSLVLEVDS